MRITEIQRFCMHDGPGLRTTVFLKGCPLNCAWCHNPETKAFAPQITYDFRNCIGCGGCMVCPNDAHIFGEDGHGFDRAKCAICGLCVAACPTGALQQSGQEMTTQQVLDAILRDAAFYGSNGGVTLSGGEPLAQMEEALELLARCKEAGLHTAVETCGIFDPKYAKALASVTDLFLWDVKDTDSVRHAQYTGASNRRILENLACIDSLGGKSRLRCILVNGVNCEPAHYEALARLAGSLMHCEGVELLPYHAYAGNKNVLLGGQDNGNKDWVPSEEQMEEAKSILKSAGLLFEG